MSVKKSVKFNAKIAVSISINKNEYIHIQICINATHTHTHSLTEKISERTSCGLETLKHTTFNKIERFFLPIHT